MKNNPELNLVLIFICIWVIGSITIWFLVKPSQIDVEEVQIERLTNHAHELSCLNRRGIYHYLPYVEENLETCVIDKTTYEWKGGDDETEGGWYHITMTRLK